MGEFLVDTFEVEVISEMAVGAGTLVPLPAEIIDGISAVDDDPKFATFMIESGFSKQKRNWRPEILEKISEQINTSSEPVVGYLGHIKPEDDGYAFPEIQLHWLKSRCQRVGDKVRLYAKAYVLPKSKGREYLAQKLVRTVSIAGDAAMKPISGGGVDVVDFDLHSIDLARPRRGGMRTALVGGLTSEMKNGGNEVDKAEIAALSVNELRAHNPTAVAEIESEAKKPLEEKVSEMETAAEEVKPEVDLLSEIRKALGLDEKSDVLATIGTLLSKVKEIGKDAKDRVFDSVLAERFKDENTRALIKRSLASEMNALEIDDESDESKKKVAEMVDSAIDKDDVLKSYVSEHDSGGGASFSKGKEQRGSREIKPGYENENIKVRSRS